MSRTLRRSGLACALLGALLAAGCGSADLSRNRRIADEVAEGLPVGTPPPALIARAVWFPKANGAGSPDASAQGGISGVLALAGDRLWFLEWNDSLRAYGTAHSWDLVRAAKVGVARSGPIDMLVVESWNLSFDSFELMRKGDFAPDGQTTRAVCDRIQAIRARNPQTDE